MPLSKLRGSRMSISVVMPVRNEQCCVKDAIESVLRQTYEDFEFVIVDDGSTDGTTEILQGFAHKDARIRVIRQPGLGFAVALNNGIRHAAHDLIARIDADDLMLEHRLERQLAFIETHPDVSALGSWAYIIDGQGRIIGRARPTIDVDRGVRERQPRLFLVLPHPSVLMRRGAVLALGGFKPEYVPADDRELWGRMVTAGHKLAVQPEFLMKIQRRPQSLSAEVKMLWRLHQLTDLVDANIVRRLSREPELSFEEHWRAVAEMPVYRRLNRARVTASRVWYSKALNRYSTRDWIRCLANLGGAALLQPIVATKRFKRVLHGEWY
jgi:glycosyltransferase involved in cell wall biosynthesis